MKLRKKGHMTSKLLEIFKCIYKKIGFPQESNSLILKIIIGTIFWEVSEKLLELKLFLCHSHFFRCEYPENGVCMCVCISQKTYAKLQPFT